MTQTHTPGPWRVHFDPCHYDTASDVKSDCGQLFASVGGKAGWKEQEANARLIAAAPDLLDELKRLRRAYVSLLETGRDRIIQAGGQCDTVEAMEAADPHLKSSLAAITKATGDA